MKNENVGMIVLCIARYESLTENIEMKLDEADHLAESADERPSHETVFGNVKSAIRGK